MKRVLLLALLAAFASPSQAQNTAQLPAHLNRLTDAVRTAEPVLKRGAVAAEPTARTMRKSGVTPRRNTAVAVTEIGKMANTFATIGQNRNQIACDPWTGTVAAVHRGNDRPGASVGNTLLVRYSSNNGATWSALQTPAQGNVSNSTSPRYPVVFLYNGNNTTTPGDVKATVLWPQVVPYAGIADTWGEINSVNMGIGNTGKVYKRFPQPPNWSIPTEIMVSYGKKQMYTIAEAVEPSNGTGTGGYHFIISKDGGANWEPLNSNLDPFWSDSQIPATASGPYSPCSDVSMDGTHLIWAYISANVENGSVPYIGENHQIAYVESTDGGLTWPTDPTYIALQDIPNLPAPLNVNAGLGIAPKLLIGDLDVVYDKNNNPHFLVTATTDQNPYDPLASGEGPDILQRTFSLRYIDSTFMCEVGRSGSSYYLNRIAQLGTIRTFRGSNMSVGSDGVYRAETKYHEPHWAVSGDGNKIYAKWIESDSTLKFPYARLTLGTNGDTSGVAYLDSVHNCYVAGRHIASTGEDMGWSAVKKVTSSTDVDVKYTKLAHFAGDAGQMHIVYTEWGIGENVDDDPNNSDCTMWYIDGVQVDAILDVEKVSDAPGDFRLGQNYPNPFNPSTVIGFTLPKGGRTSLKIYNVLGKEVATVFDKTLDAGTHQVTFDGASLPSGVYLYRLQSGSSVATRSMTLSK